MFSFAVLAIIYFNSYHLDFSCSYQSCQVVSQSTSNDKFDQAGLDRKFNFVQNKLIKFATFRVNDTSFPFLRQIVVVRPKELVELSQAHELAVLDKLVELLKDPDRAYAADVMLVAMTGSPQDTDIVARYYDNPKLWWGLIGKSTYGRWSKWLRENREHLVWNAEKRVFDIKTSDK